MHQTTLKHIEIIFIYLFNTGNYYIALKDTTAAVSYWEKAIAVAPANDKLNAFLATYFRKKGNTEKYLFYSQKISSKVK